MQATPKPKNTSNIHLFFFGLLCLLIMSHSQLTHLTNYQNKKNRSSPSSSLSLSSSESSFSSNSISYINQNFLFSNKTSTPTPTSSITSHSSSCASCFNLNPSFNKPPLLSLLIHQNITTHCSSNVILSNLKHFLFSFMTNHADMPATPGVSFWKQLFIIKVV